MKLSESQARRVARGIVSEMAYVGQPLTHELRRPLTEDEATELIDLYQRKLEETLGEFEFLDPEVVPKIDRVEAWCEEHRGRGYQRPKGKVVYTVTGDTVLFEHGLMRRHVPEVQRSSDGKKQPMTMQELSEMIDLDA